MNLNLVPMNKAAAKAFYEDMDQHTGVARLDTVFYGQPTLSAEVGVYGVYGTVKRVAKEDGSATFATIICFEPDRIENLHAKFYIQVNETISFDSAVSDLNYAMKTVWDSNDHDEVESFLMRSAA